nr:hypothetical protein Iba_chr05aCG9910 [Ipomoea batatas]
MTSEECTNNPFHRINSMVTNRSHSTLRYPSSQSSLRHQYLLAAEMGEKWRGNETRLKYKFRSVVVSGLGERRWQAVSGVVVVGVKSR